MAKASPKTLNPVKVSKSVKDTYDALNSKIQNVADAINSADNSLLNKIKNASEEFAKKFLQKSPKSEKKVQEQLDKVKDIKEGIKPEDIVAADFVNKVGQAVAEQSQDIDPQNGRTLLKISNTLETISGQIKNISDHIIDRQDTEIRRVSRTPEPKTITKVSSEPNTKENSSSGSLLGAVLAGLAALLGLNPGALIELFKKLKNFIGNPFSFITDALGKGFGLAKDVLFDLVSKLKSFLMNPLDFILDVLGKGFGVAKDVFLELMGKLKNFLMSPLSFILDALKGGLNGLKALLEPLIKSFVLPAVKFAFDPFKNLLKDLFFKWNGFTDWVAKLLNARNAFRIANLASKLGSIGAPAPKPANTGKVGAPPKTSLYDRNKPETKTPKDAKTGFFKPDSEAAKTSKKPEPVKKIEAPTKVSETTKKSWFQGKVDAFKNFTSKVADDASQFAKRKFDDFKNTKYGKIITSGYDKLSAKSKALMDSALKTFDKVKGFIVDSFNRISNAVKAGMTKVSENLIKPFVNFVKKCFNKLFGNTLMSKYLPKVLDNIGSIMKRVGSLALTGGLKLLPVAGFAIGVYVAIDFFMENKWILGTLAALSAVVSLVPGIGGVIALCLDLGIFIGDSIMNNPKEAEKLNEEQTQIQQKLAEMMKDPKNSGLLEPTESERRLGDGRERDYTQFAGLNRSQAIWAEESINSKEAELENINYKLKTIDSQMINIENDETKDEQSKKTELEALKERKRRIEEEKYQKEIEIRKILTETEKIKWQNYDKNFKNDSEYQSLRKKWVDLEKKSDSLLNLDRFDSGIVDEKQVEKDLIQSRKYKEQALEAKKELENYISSKSSDEVKDLVHDNKINGSSEISKVPQNVVNTIINNETKEVKYITNESDKVSDTTSTTSPSPDDPKSSILPSIALPAIAGTAIALPVIAGSTGKGESGTTSASLPSSSATVGTSKSPSSTAGSSSSSTSSSPSTSGTSSPTSKPSSGSSLGASTLAAASAITATAATVATGAAGAAVAATQKRLQGIDSKPDPAPPKSQSKPKSEGSSKGHTPPEASKNCIKGECLVPKGSKTGGTYASRAAAEIARNNALPATKGICATHVRAALQAAGYPLKTFPPLAKQYTSYLPKIGFEYIGTGDKVKPQVGDILVSPPAPDAAPNKTAGHIAIYSGVNPTPWASDFRHRLNVYGHRGLPNSEIKIYRDTKDIVPKEITDANLKDSTKAFNIAKVKKQPINFSDAPFRVKSGESKVAQKLATSKPVESLKETKGNAKLETSKTPEIKLEVSDKPDPQAPKQNKKYQDYKFVPKGTDFISKASKKNLGSDYDYLNNSSDEKVLKETGKTKAQWVESLGLNSTVVSKPIKNIKIEENKQIIINNNSSNQINVPQSLKPSMNDLNDAFVF